MPSPITQNTLFYGDTLSILGECVANGSRRYIGWAPITCSIDSGPGRDRRRPTGSPTTRWSGEAGSTHVRGADSDSAGGPRVDAGPTGGAGGSHAVLHFHPGTGARIPARRSGPAPPRRRAGAECPRSAG